MPKRIIVLFLLVLFLMTNCALLKFYPAKQKIKSSRTQAEKNFNPLGFEEDKKILTQQEYQGRSEVGGEMEQGEVQIEADSSREIENQYKTIYRVQVYASKIPSEATFFADSIRTVLDSQKIYVEYQSPYYRVRIGHCSNFDEAEDLLNKLKKMGLDQAWVVKTRIRIEDEEN
jgi:hypothetical protein